MPTLANGHQWRYRVIVRWVDLGNRQLASG